MYKRLPLLTVRVMAIVGHEDMETTNVYVRKAGIELVGGTEKLGYKVNGNEFVEITIPHYVMEKKLR